jgi:hypothetical protein
MGHFNVGRQCRFYKWGISNGNGIPNDKYRFPLMGLCSKAEKGKNKKRSYPELIHMN